jgi:alanine dehydrogenase
MILGCPKEIKVREYRVGLVPGGVQTLVGRGHTVLVEKGAGVGSGIPDESYARAGAQIVDSAREVWQRAQMIVKVKEPVETEYGLMQEGQTIYTYFHLAAVPSLAKVLLEKKVSAVAYETIQTEDGQLPLLKPMSEVAGRMAVQIGAVMLEKEHGGKGILLSGVPGVRRGRVAILGGGTVGTNAAKLASGMGAETVILDVNTSRLAYLDDIFSSSTRTRSRSRSTFARPTSWSAACSSPAPRRPSSSARSSSRRWPRAAWWSTWPSTRVAASKPAAPPRTTIRRTWCTASSTIA